MVSIGKAQIKADLTEILGGADLTQLSSKKVRRQLEEKYSEDLSERKKEIDELLLVVIGELEKAKAAVESKANGTRKRASPQKAEASDSEDDLSDESDFEEPEDTVQKKSKAKKAKTDEELARQLQDEEESTGRRTRGGGRKTPVKKKRAPPAEGKKKRKVGYTREKWLSTDLANVIGITKGARNDVVKRLWEIARERELFNPKNRQFIICDDDLYRLFGRKKVRMFGCMKYLERHILHDVSEEEQKAFVTEEEQENSS